MIKNALGLIEVVGLVAGMEAADAAVKAANIELIGYELSKGGGLVVIKITGDVGAVQAAVAAATASASKVGKVFSSHVIPRPAAGLERMITTRETVGAPPEPEPCEPASAEEPEQAPEAEPAPEPPAMEANEDSHPAEQPAEICNLCGDPACQRRKGDPKTTCIHHKKHHKEE